MTCECLVVLWSFAPLFFLSLAPPACAQTNLVTPWAYLQSQPKPNFATGNTLPLLTRCGWDTQISTNTHIELANNWGFTLPIDCLNANVTNIFNTNSVFNVFVNMASNNPTKYKLMIWMNIIWPQPIPSGFYCTNSAGMFVDMTGTNTWAGPNAYTNGHTPVMCPEAPDNYLQQAANYWVGNLIYVLSNAPVAYIETDGEYGLGGKTYAKAWAADPRVQSALATNVGVISGGVTNWYLYATLKKCHQLQMVRNAINTVDPNRVLNIWYAHSECEGTENQASGGFIDNQVVPATGDLPSLETYCLNYRNGPFLISSNIINGQNYDLLTKFLNGQGYMIANGWPLEYSWVTGGCYYDQSTHAPAAIYKGLLKCLCTGGAWGLQAGYYGVPTQTPTDGQSGWNDTFDPANPPDWIVQIMSAAHTEALFSHLANFLTNGDLLSGSESNSLSPSQPAYEFTNTAGYANDRVLARKLRGQNQWLVTAWAADGTNRIVTVNIPTVGPLSLLAADIGSVYQVTMTGTNVQQRLLDEYTSFGVAPPTDLHVMPP